MKKLYKLEIYETHETDWDDYRQSLGIHHAWAYSEKQAFNFIKRRLHLFNSMRYNEYIHYQYITR